MKLWPVAEDTFLVNILHFCQNRHFRAQQEVGQGALPDGGLNCWYSASVHFPPPPTHPPQPTCSRFQNEIRQSCTFNSNTVAQTSTLRTRVSGLLASSENWGSRTRRDLHKRSMSCWHRTRNLWPSGWASQAKQPPQLPLWLSHLACSHILHICVLCGQEERAWTRPIAEPTYALSMCNSTRLASRWLCHWIYSILKVAPWKTVGTLPDARW